MMYSNRPDGRNYEREVSKMAERVGDGTYKRFLVEEQEDEFIDKAVKSISEGKNWDKFLSENAQYTVMGTAKWHSLYDQMQDRRSKSIKGTWGLKKEMEFARNRRMQARLQQDDEKTYQTHRADLLELAADHASWNEAKRRLSLTDDYEKYFRKAQSEAGVLRSSERADPYDEAFSLGFFS